jgi:hypothetical protein
MKVIQSQNYFLRMPINMILIKNINKSEIDTNFREVSIIRENL